MLSASFVLVGWSLAMGLSIMEALAAGTRVRVSQNRVQALNAKPHAKKHFVISRLAKENLDFHLHP